MARFERFSQRISGLFRPTARQMVANGLYNTIVAQARHPSFYRDADVADTLDGRFDMIILHAFVVMHRLRDAGENGQVVSQALFDEMFADMDRSLREMGVGDMGIGRRVRAMGKAFLGRVEAYQTALDEGGDQLNVAIMRNLYRDDGLPHEGAARMGDYVRAKIDLLAMQPLPALMEGKVDFGSPLEDVSA